MIHIDEDLQQDYLQDSVPKQLQIITEEDAPTKLDGINWYIGDCNGTAETTWDPPSSSSQYFDMTCQSNESGWKLFLFGGGNFPTNDVYNKYISDSRYLYMSVMFKFTSITTAPAKMDMAIGAKLKSSTNVIRNTYPTDIDSFEQNSWVRLFSCITNPEVMQAVDGGWIRTYGPCNFTVRVYAIQVQSSDIYYSDLDFYQRHPEDGVMPYLGESAIRKGVDVSDLIHIHQPNIADVLNTNLDSEAFTLTENLCSEDKLKFGACESSYCEFTIKDRQDNWKDRIIRPYITTRDEAYSVSQINWYKGSSNWNPGDTQTYTYRNSNYSWDMSTDEHQLAPNLNYEEFQSLGVTYGKIVLGVKMRVKFTIFDEAFMPYKIRLYLRVLYDTDQTRDWATWSSISEFLISDITDDFVDFYCYLAFQPISTAILFENIYEISKLQYRLFDENGNRYASNLGTFSYTVEIKDLQLCLCDEIYWTDFAEYDVEDCIEYQGVTDIDEYLVSKTGNIPLGRFYVTDIEEEYDRAVRTLNITAYDALYKLEANAKDWCTSFMYLICFSTESSMLKGGKAFVRQVFTSYWNAIVQAGIDSRDRHTETVIYSGDYDTGTVGTDDYTGTSSHKCQYKYFDLDVSSYTNKVFVMDLEMSTWNPDYTTPAEYAQYVDSAGRGWKNAQILIQTGTTSGKRYCVDSGDYFKLPDDCTTIRIWRPITMSGSGMCFDFTISNVDYEFDLTNADARLTYFNWATLNLCAYNSDVTIRDIVRSLLEVTGCFFTVDRWGNPQFKYCTKAGLYPSNTLYPADDLYPRGAAGASLLPMHYIKSRREDFTVQNIGKIQIVKQQRSNEAKSICEFEYIGDATAVNTYLIEDNIFYCHEDLEYGVDMATDVLEVLQNMYSRISNLGYVPNLLNCVGLPWIETGDRIVVMTQTGGFESFIFERHLKGIQALKDEFESKGEEYTKAISKYEYTTTMT